MCSGRPARARESDGAGLRRQAGADAGPRRGGLEKWDSVTHERPIRCRQQRCGNRRRRNCAGGSADQRQRRLRGHGHRADAGNRTVEGHTWVWVWNGAGDVVQPNTQAQIVADKKSYQVGDTAHLLLVTGLQSRGPWSRPRATACSRGRLIHATGASVAFDVPITKQAQPNLVVTRGDRPQRPVDDGAKEPQGPACRADADHHGDAEQDAVPARRERQLRRAALSIHGQAGAGRPELWRGG